ncbi:Clp protease [Evansella caseinilytica]|uniref:ATP-dependent Clp protease proteolytic subunit n=1 Tax=Evansella caseinilytica TaxID=1503961 RepID=A0A1H3UBE2_9BACI|nr:head maturation protease, ClpP-related [Evansella caseinilytica]SDZ59790.1 Clp protease [Evansella caseinilytica]
MAKRIEVKGVIVNNSDYQVYEWLDIEATCPRVVHEQLGKANGKAVEVDINSGGGDVFAGSEIYSALKAYSMNGGHVTVNIVGLAASAASVVAMAGDRVMMSATSQLMIHNAWINGASGDYRNMEHMSGVLKNVNQTIANAYHLKTGRSQEELLALMDEETWLTVQQALELGFVDGILFEGKGVLKGSNLSKEPEHTGLCSLNNNKVAASVAHLNLLKLKVGI